MPLRLVPSWYPALGLAETPAAAQVKSDVRTMGPPWEPHDGDDAPLLRGQESEVKTQYHAMCRSRSVLAGALFVSDPQGTRFVWDRRTFRWEVVLPQPA